MASYWDKVDARWCTTCHSEHQPDISLPGMVTLQGDYCVACHSTGDQDVRVNRPTHEGLTFDTCASSGCHNFHDNRALYEDFLVKHADQPWLAEAPIHPAAAIAHDHSVPDPAEIEAYLAKIDAPDVYHQDEIETHWAASAHAAADVGCASCHAPKSESEAEIIANWVERPEEAVCASCHRSESQTFAMGRHGMRRHPEIAKPRDTERQLKLLGWKKPSDAVIATLEAYLNDPTPAPKMNTAEARVPLIPSAHGRELTCNTCHAPHEQDTSYAAVDACLTCHGDDHSRAYRDSPHFQLWQAERTGDLPPGSGVTCATCHMPQEEKRGKVTTNHNQNDTLRPNEKMIRPVCMNCHGLPFAIDALADPALVAANFSGEPSRSVDSIDWAVSRVTGPAEGAKP